MFELAADEVLHIKTGEGNLPSLSVLSVEKAPYIPPNTMASDVVVTSQHALYALADFCQPGARVWCVGEGTASKASKDFKVYYPQEANVVQLGALIRQSGISNLTYLRAEEVSEDLTVLLPEVTITQVVVYRAVPRVSLSSAEVKMLKEYDQYAIYSKKNARALLALLDAYGVDISEKIAACASDSIAAFLREQEARTQSRWQEVKVIHLGR
jgi:uroporphyrinogen-III synthase